MNPDRRDLIFELTPGWIEGWLRVERVCVSGRLKVLESGHNFRRTLEPTRYVLQDLIDTLLKIQESNQDIDRIKIGLVGNRILERFKKKSNDWSQHANQHHNRRNQPDARSKLPR